MAVQDVPSNIEDDETQVLLGEWLSLQDDIRGFQDREHRWLTRGAVGLAGVIGYAVQTSALWLLALVPVVLTLVFVVFVQLSNQVYYREWQSYRIERELDVASFDWTRSFAGLTRPNKLASPDISYSRFDISWRQSATGAAQVIAALVYVSFIVFTVRDVIPSYLGDEVAGLPVVPLGALFYVLLTGFAVAVGATHWKIRLDFKRLERAD